MELIPVLIHPSCFYDLCVRSSWTMLEFLYQWLAGAPASFCLQLSLHPVSHYEVTQYHFYYCYTLDQRLLLASPCP